MFEFKNEFAKSPRERIAVFVGTVEGKRVKVYAHYKPHSVPYFIPSAKRMAKMLDSFLCLGIEPNKNVTKDIFGRNHVWFEFRVCFDEPRNVNVRDIAYSICPYAPL